jgi:hypothetical protein
MTGKNVRSLNALPILLVVFAGCQTDSARRGVDSAAGPKAATLVADTLRPPKQPAAGLSSVAAEPMQVCETVAQRWRRVAFSTVELRDTVASPRNHDQQHPERPDEVLPPTPACLVTARADSAIPDRRALYWPAPDWAAILSMSADGPDGNMMTYQRGIVRCEVSNSWDGEDDADTTKVPLKWYAQRTTCWRHNRTLIPADTVTF